MIFLIDKPDEITSQGVVSRIKYALRSVGVDVKVGHSGTLDPMCTGLLPVFSGKDTRLINILPHKKAYRATMLLGVETDTEDVTGTVLSEKTVTVGFSDVKAAAGKFVGEIMQTPPMYSAIKKNGKKLYELAREGIETEREARKITVYSLDVSRTEKENEYALDVKCSSGTYIRTLCADIGKALGCGAAMSSLRRTFSNGFSLENAVPLDVAVERIKDGEVSSVALSSEDAFDFPKITVPENGLKYYLNGGAILLSRTDMPLADGLLKVYAQSGEFCGFGKTENGCVKAIVNYLN